MTVDELAARKAQLIAQSDLERMRIAHAVLTARQAMSPSAWLGGGAMRSFAGQAIGFALPLFARRSGLLRAAAFALAAVRMLRRVLHR